MLQHIGGSYKILAITALLAIGSSLGCGDDSSSEDNDKGSAGKGGGGGSGGSANGGKGGGSSEPVSDALKGTGESCHSYTEPTDGKCQGWFCGVTEEKLMEVVDPKAKCGGNVPLLCKGSVPIAVGKCARQIKAANFNKSNDELRPLVRDCVYEDAAIKDAVPEDCLNCTIDAAACAADNCLPQCIGGDSETCDTCRRDAGCDQSVFSCGGLPPPIE